MSSFKTLLPVIAWMLVAGFGEAAMAQPKPSGAPAPTRVDPSKATQPKQAPVSGGGTAVVELSDEPFRMDSVGLSVRVPTGAKVNSSRAGGKATACIQSPGDTWMINIQTPHSEAADIKEAMDKTISLIQGSYGIVDPDQRDVLKTQARILQRTDSLTLPGGPAARLYVSTPKVDKSRLVKGYTIFNPAPQQFVVFEFICHEQDFAKLRGIYETVVGTAVFENADAVVKARVEAVKAGSEFVRTLSEQDLAAQMNGKETWFRLFRPGKTGAKSDDEEIGYRGVKLWRGQRGEINPDKPKSTWGKADQQEGYLAQNRSRVLMTNGAADTVAIYYQSLDRSEEYWTIITSVKDATGHELSWARETGARNKSDMQVVCSNSNRPMTTVRPPLVNEGYITQLETVLLPRLLVQKRVAKDVGFYCWQPSPGGEPGAIVFRKDSPTLQGKLFALKTTFRDDNAAQVSSYSEKGELLRTELPQGMAWEPVDLMALKRLWQQKGLPVDR